MTEFTLDDTSTTIDTEVLDKMIMDAAHKAQEKELEAVALALKQGYDGVDIKYTDGLYEPAPFSFNMTTWKGEAPRGPQHDPPFDYRYDFRNMTDREKEQLLERAGVLRNE